MPSDRSSDTQLHSDQVEIGSILSGEKTASAAFLEFRRVVRFFLVQLDRKSVSSVGAVLFGIIGQRVNQFSRCGSLWYSWTDSQSVRFSLVQLDRQSVSRCGSRWYSWTDSHSVGAVLVGTVGQRVNQFSRCGSLWYSWTKSQSVKSLRFSLVQLDRKSVSRSMLGKRSVVTRVLSIPKYGNKCIEHSQVHYSSLIMISVIVTVLPLSVLTSHSCILSNIIRKNSLP